MLALCVCSFNLGLIDVDTVRVNIQAKKHYLHHSLLLGRAMAQVISRRPLIVEARVRSRINPCGICGGQNGTGTGFSPSTSVFHCQFHSTGAPLLGKTKKN
jgi:hypothetical protein